MAVPVIAPTTQLAERFRAAADRPPLSALGAGAERELAAVLAGVEAFEDLPGKWQAALLESEAARAAAEPAHARACCRHHGAHAG